MSALDTAQGARLGATGAFNRADWARLSGFYAVIAALHLAGAGLFLHHVGAHPALAGLGFAAYMLGLRHAFDADHIAAVDDTVRLLLQSGQRPLGAGFFFSLGHSTVVLILALGLSLLAGALVTKMPGFAATGFYGLIAPARTPPAVIARLNAEVEAVLRSNETRERLVGLGAEPMVATPEEFSSFIAAQLALWGKVIRDANIEQQ